MQSNLCYIAYFNEFKLFGDVYNDILVFDKDYVPFVS